MTGSNASGGGRPAWKRIGAYCWQCGDYRVAQVGYAGRVKWTVYHQWEFLGWHDSVAEARAAAKRHSEGKR